MEPLASIASSAGISLLLLIVLVFLMKNWYLARLENSIKHEYNTKLEKLTDELRRKTDVELAHVNAELAKEIELQRLRLGPYSEMQFATYNRIWRNLNQLKYAMHRLWEGATEEHFKEFSDLLDETTTELENSALLFNEDHYNEMIRIVNEFWNLQMGKKKFMAYRNSGMQLDPKEITRMINDNRQHVTKLQNNIISMMKIMRRQLSNEIATGQSNAAEQPRESR